MTAKRWAAARFATGLAAVVLVFAVSGCGLRDRAPGEVDNGVDSGSTEQSTTVGDDALDQILDELQAVDAAVAQVDSDVASGQAAEAKGD